jgi:arsenate reductase
MDMIEYWHNPRCSKSRQGLALLEEQGAKLRIRPYLSTPPSLAELTTAWEALGRPPVIDMVRTGEKTFRELGLTKDSPDSDLLEAMAANPILIERPLAISDGRAVIGRPPEALLDLL